MRICIVTPDFGGGGAERVAVNLANEYKLKGYEVFLIAIKKGGPNKVNLNDGIKVLELNSRYRVATVKLYSELKTLEPDVVFSVIREVNILVGLSSIFTKAKVVFREANTLDLLNSKPTCYRILFKLLMRLSYHFSDKVIANSNDTKGDLLKSRIISNNKCVVINNPVYNENMLHLACEKVEHPWFLNPKIEVILSVGRLHVQKNHKLLIESFKLVYENRSNARLVIIGQGEEYLNLLDLVSKLGINDVVEILPYQQNPYKFYHNADLFVLSSSWEGFGNVIVEAMACHTPVISTNCPGGPRDILQNGILGDLVEPDAAVLAETILANLESKSLSRVEAAFESSKKYSISSIANKYLRTVC